MEDFSIRLKFNKETLRVAYIGETIMIIKTFDVEKIIDKLTNIMYDALKDDSIPKRFHDDVDNINQRIIDEHINSFYVNNQMGFREFVIDFDDLYENINICVVYDPDDDYKYMSIILADYLIEEKEVNIFEI